MMLALPELPNNLYDFEPEKRAALDQLAAQIGALVGNP
jgi:hypothetical protein